MGNLLQDIRYGFRMWKKTPVITVVTVLSLGLAIAANTTMFALAGGFLFQPFPYEDQENVLIIERADIGEETSDDGESLSPPDFVDLQSQVTSFSGVCAFDDEPYIVSDFDQPQEVLVTTVSANLFDVLGVEPLLGRTGVTEGQIAGERNILVLDFGYWQQQYNGDEDVLGATLTLNQIPYTIVGVMDEDFNLMQGDIAAYHPTDFVGYTDRADRDYLVLGRLGEGVSLEQANAELTAFAAGLAQEFPDTHDGKTMIVMRLRERIPGRTDTMLITMALVVTFLGLLIASANIANLLLSKAGTRMKEVAVRITLGANRAGLFRQFLVESVLLSVTAGLVGVLLSFWAVALFQTGFPADLPRMFLPKIDGSVLLITAGISVLAGIIFGLAPALFVMVKDVRGALNDGGRGGTVGRRWKGIRHAFVIGEVAVALGVLTGAGLLANIFNDILDPEPGFNGAGLIGFELSLPAYKYPDSDAILRFHREAIPALEQIPGVEGVAVMNSLPRTRNYSNAYFSLPGQTFDDLDDRPVTGWQAVNAEYLTTLEGSLLAGRFLEPGDRDDTQPVAVVNQSFVDLHLAGGVPIGTSIEMLEGSREIVGVIANICQERIPDEWTIDPMVYIPLEQNPLRFPTIALRSTVDRSRVAESARLAIWSVDPDQPIGALKTYDEFYTESLGAASVFGDFLFIICLMTVFLAAMGIFGIISHAVLLRTREIGIRVSVGARAGQVVGMMTRQGLWLTAKGFILGLPLVFLMSRAVKTIFLFSDDMRLPLAGFSTLALLAVFSLLASWLPARRAARVQPIDALNAD
ncbi:ABC transporter permease [Candidatus Zixiibacteriota bacterium]